MEEKEKLLIAGNYPHALMRHMNTLVKEKGRSILWDGSFVQLFAGRFPEFGQELNILREAYSLKVPERFQKADRQAVWSKRVCITQSLFVLVQKLKEYEAVICVESFMCLLGWDVQVFVERKWEASIEDRANFHQMEGRNASGQVDLERRAREQMQESNQKGQDAYRTMEREHSKIPESSIYNAELPALETGRQADSAGKDRASAADSSRPDASVPPVENTGGTEGVLPQTDGIEPKRDIKFIAQMNFGMRKEVKRAQKGNADSQQRLGGFYSEEGTNHLDYREAVYWYQLSAKQGNYKSQMELGRIFDSGKIEGADSKSQGLYWYRKLAEEGFPTAQCILGAKYLWGDGVKESKREAVYWFKKAAAQGHEEAKGYLSGLI